MIYYNVDDGMAYHSTRIYRAEIIGHIDMSKNSIPVYDPWDSSRTAIVLSSKRIERPSLIENSNRMCVSREISVFDKIAISEYINDNMKSEVDSILAEIKLGFM